jgi:hypothetical protein
MRYNRILKLVRAVGFAPTRDVFPQPEASHQIPKGIDEFVPR